MNKSTFEEELEKNSRLVYTNVGDSMLPLIRKDGDLIVIKKKDGTYKKRDVLFYKRDSGQYVLHRFIKKQKDGSFITVGDNRWHFDIPVREDQILGVLESVVRNGKEMRMDSFKCKLYAHLWCDVYPLRFFILFLLQLPTTIKRRFKK